MSQTDTTLAGNPVDKLDGDFDGLLAVALGLEMTAKQMDDAGLAIHNTIQGGAGRGRAVTRLKEDATEFAFSIRATAAYYRKMSAPVLEYAVAGAELKPRLKDASRAVVRARVLYELEANQQGQFGDSMSSGAPGTNNFDAYLGSSKDLTDKEAADLEVRKRLYQDWTDACEAYDVLWKQWDELYDDILGRMKDALNGMPEDKHRGKYDFTRIISEGLDFASLAPGAGTVASLLNIGPMITLTASGEKDGKDWLWFGVGFIPFGKWAERGAASKSLSKEALKYTDDALNSKTFKELVKDREYAQLLLDMSMRGMFGLKAKDIATSSPEALLKAFAAGGIGRSRDGVLYIKQLNESTDGVKERLGIKEKPELTKERRAAAEQRDQLEQRIERRRAKRRDDD